MGTERLKINNMPVRFATCNRCNHTWQLRNYNKIPKNCPNCKSPYWNKERIREKKDRDWRGGTSSISTLGYSASPFLPRKTALARAFYEKIAPTHALTGAARGKGDYNKELISSLERPRIQHNRVKTGSFWGGGIADSLIFSYIAQNSELFMYSVLW